MMTILEELWYGNVDPEQERIGNSKEVKELRKLIAANRDRLDRTMTEKQREILERYDDCNVEMNSIIEMEIFSYAFRLGGRLMLATVVGDV